MNPSVKLDRFRDKIAVVTGGAQGIGRATVERMAMEGGKVFIVDRAEDAARATAKALCAEGLDVDVAIADMGTWAGASKGCVVKTTPGPQGISWPTPSDSSISCRQTGPIKIGDIDLGKEGEEVFNQGISLIWKQQVVNRIYDAKNQTLIYLSHSRQVQDGSAKMAISSVPLFS